MIQQTRMPYVKFYTEVKETKDDEGHINRENVYMAEVTPAGGKDTQIKVVDEWLKTLKGMADQRRGFDGAANEYDEWYRRVSEGYEKFKKGEEMTYEGTPIRSSLAFTKAEIANCEAANVFTLEDLAVANEEALSRIGMGSRGLQDKAKALLKSNDSTKLAEENAALRQKLEEQGEQIKELMELVKKDQKTLTVKKVA